MGHSFIVPLDKIPPEGLSFRFTPSSSEWAQSLKPLLGENGYQILIFIQPTQDSLSEFHITGHIKTHLDLVCSRCAIDFKYPIDKKISEKVYIQSQKTETEIFIPFKADEEEMTVLSKARLDLLQFVHELIAIEEPMKPLGRPSCDLNDDCENLALIKKEIDLKKTENDSPSESDTKMHRPFANLDKFL